jgi:glutathione S-transferase
VWLLEELGVPYETKLVEIRRADGSGARDPANPHPHSKVPCLQHDGQRGFEIVAITLYLTDLFPEAKLGRRVGDPNRGEYLSWLAYRPGVIKPAMMMRRLSVKHVQGGMGWAETPVRPAFRRLLEKDGAWRTTGASAVPVAIVP